MANQFRGFGRLLSTANNSTRKEGFWWGAAAPVDDIGPRTLTDAERKKLVNREVDRDMIKVLSIGVAGGVVLSILYGTVAFGWDVYMNTLKKDALRGDKDYETQMGIQPMNVKR
ncbi:hypothetical protein MKW94_000210 [Papaver nudicaule]|uniref:Uncharacterized protein n=1 Tax=Papaver nudicaule TaxID=74823 RepID=A0AA41VFN4_PAPNU|nr:hypothetical protein [Papaver nudicaule]